MPASCLHQEIWAHDSYFISLLYTGCMINSCFKILLITFKASHGPAVKPTKDFLNGEWSGVPQGSIIGSHIFNNFSKDFALS